MHLGGVARSAGGAERKSRGREGEKFLIYTGPEGKPGGESRFLKLMAYAIQSYYYYYYFIYFYFFFEKIIYFIGRLGSLFSGRQKFCWDLHKAVAQSFNLSLPLFVFNLFFSLFF